MKKVLVVGAGISGLSAAIYARRSGFDVTVCEQHSVAGGMCCGWRRKGYLFEGAVHWLTGSNPKMPMRQMWEDTGALNAGVKVSLHEPFKSVEWEGQTISIYRDIDKTTAHLVSVSPVDKKPILKMAKEVKALSVFNRPLSDVRGVKRQQPKRRFVASPKMLPALFIALRLFNTLWAKYVKRFKHPGIKELLLTVPGNYSAINSIFTMAILSAGDGGYPEGGSFGMIERMTKTFAELGGTLLLNTKVKKVNIEKGAVTGLTLENETLPADAVIVTQETIAALDQLFDPPLREPWLLRLRKKTKSVVSTFAGVGIRAELPQSPIPAWQLEEPLLYGGIREASLGFYNYAGHEGFAPQGCSVLTAILKGDTYDFWKRAKEEGRYEEEKRSLADQIGKALCRKYPQLEGKIDVIDIATPLTYERYTGAYHGSWMTILHQGDALKAYPGSCKTAQGLYFAGHRIMPPGGLPLALDSGRRAAQLLCRQFGAVFK